MKSLLPLVLFAVAIPSRADMVLLDDSQSSAVLHLLQQRFSAIEFRDFFTQNRLPSIALFRVNDNRGLAIGLSNDRSNQAWNRPFFPGTGAPASREPIGDSEPAEQQLSSLSTPEPTTYAVLGAAIGGMLLLRRRKR